MSARTSLRPIRWLLVLAACVWLLPAPAQATVALRLSLAELLAESDLVVRAKVIKASSAWNLGKTAIYTDTTVELMESMKGAVPRDRQLVVRQMGGKVDGIVMDVAGNARLQKTEEVVLFLKQEGKYAYVVGLAQGKFTVFKDAQGQELVRRDLTGLAFMPAYSAPPGQVAFTPGGWEPARSLADFKARIAQLLGSSPPAGEAR